MPTRMAIWAAVSTKGQAKGWGSDVDELDDKDSLKVQIEKCRAAGQGRGWIESCQPFVVPGESRTRHVNLRDAEEEIPALKDMLNAAQRGAFDVLCLYDYTRLRELLDPVARTLSAYRVQMFSISQPVEPVPPEEYDPANSDTANVMQFVSSFTSRSELAAFKRRRQFGMPRRVAKGLPPGTIPFGYRKPPGREMDRKAVPVQDPAEATTVLKMRDRFLTGWSLIQLADWLNDQGIRTPRGGTTWSDVSVRGILKSRFYVGEVSYGASHSVTDPRTGKVRHIDHPPGRALVARGLHQPLWDEATQRAIDDEFARRGRKYAGIRTQRLSGLLYCSVCGSRCWVGYPGGYSDKRRRWACSKDPQHVNIRDDMLLPLVAEEVVRLVRDIDNIQLPAPEDRRALLTAALSDLQARRTRLLDAYEAGTLALPDYSARVPDLSAQIAQKERELADAQGMASRQNERLERIGGLAGILQQLPVYLLTAEPLEVNSHLRAIFEKIIVTPEGGVELVLAG